MTLSPNQQAALEQPVARVVYFVRMDFASGSQYVCSANQTIAWDGHDWLGMGVLGSISPVEESDGLEPKALSFVLNVAQPEWLTVAIGAVEEYRGRDIVMWFCPLDESFVMVGEPVVCWRGIMDVVTVGIDGEEGQIALKAETSAYGLKRQPALRLNAAQQKQKYPSDTGLDYLQSLIAQPALWLSKRFQQI